MKIATFLTVCFISLSLNSIRCFKRFHSATRIRLASVNPNIDIKDYVDVKIEVEIGKNINVICTSKFLSVKNLVPF